MLQTGQKEWITVFLMSFSPFSTLLYQKDYLLFPFSPAGVVTAPSYSAEPMALFQLWKKDKDKQIPKYEHQVLISDFNHLTGSLKSDLNPFFGASTWHNNKTDHEDDDRA